MPTYDYVCDACKHAFEEFQSIMAKPMRKCPKCKANKLRRLIGAGAGIIFKGSGFYQTDYRSDSYKEAAKKDSVSSSSSTSSPASTSDKTPAGSTSPTPSTDSAKPSSKAGKKK